MGVTGFDSEREVVKRADLTITVKVINLWSTPAKVAA
tara:strand:+ start:367 stop:477 length:111 start_codon:yes stop_codon:yes gene_type:complete